MSLRTERSKKQIRIDWGTLTPRQTEFMKCNTKFCFYGGARGKL